MLKHYLTSTLRHFARHKTVAAFNMVSLLLGLVCFLGAHAVVTTIKSSDQQFAHAERIFSITQKIIPPGSNVSIPAFTFTAWPVAEHLKADMPQLAAVARLTMSAEMPLSTDATKTFAKVSYADPAFFDVFSWPFAVGDATHALRDRNTAVLTEATAVRLFGSAAQAFGRTVLLGGRIPLTITGVMAPLRGLSHIGPDLMFADFDILATTELFESTASSDLLRDWNSTVNLTYVVLPADGSFTFEALKSRLATFDQRYVPAADWRSKFDAVPVSHAVVVLANILVGTDKSGVSIVALLYILGALVLFVSALNYANLATAQATTRAKEIGLRRVVGASRTALVSQYLGEAVLLAMGAAILAHCVVTIVATGLPHSAPSALQFAFEYFVAQLPLVLGMAVAVGVLAGSYPALILSGVSVAGALRSGRVRGGPRFVPSLLVAIQFAATSFLVIAILVMSAQKTILAGAALSREGDPLVLISNDMAASNVAFETLRSELLNQPHVRSVTAAARMPWEESVALRSLSVLPESTAQRWNVCKNAVERDYLNTMNIPLIAGRQFDASRDNLARQGDSIADDTPIIIDRALAEHSGWTPGDAIGKQLYMWKPGADDSAPPSFRIIGVAENKPLRLRGFGATSDFFVQDTKSAKFPIVRIASTDVRAGLREIDAVWSKLAPNIAIKRRFEVEALNSALQSLSVVERVFQTAATLALVIAVLGLIGMSVHVIGRRTHEIGVRKTLGASVWQVLTLLLKDFSRPVLIANLVAWPAAFLAASVYLSVFVTRSSLSPAPFAISLLFTLFIAWLAVGLQAIRAAKLNPATVLRHE